MPSFVDDGIELEVAGSGFTSAVDLGAGDHMLDVCATFGILSGCTSLPLRIDPVLADDASSDYRAAEIELQPLMTTARGGGPSLSLGDDEVVAVALPPGFVFPFFGEEMDTIWVGANGGIRFSSGLIAPSNSAFPASTGPDIAVYWDDLDPTLAGRVVTHLELDRFVVAWESVAVAAGGTISAEAHLFRDGRIELHYPSVAAGPDAFGASATVGVQFDGDALELSMDDPSLLESAAGIAIDTTTCIASALRIPDTTPCHDVVPVQPIQIDICGVSADVELTVPGMPTICAPHGADLVSGDLYAGLERVPVAEDGTFELHAGAYVAEWSISGPVTFPVASEVYGRVSEVSSQPVTVAITDDEAVCCRDDQTLNVLTSGNDGPLGGCSSGSCCVVALAGNDNVWVGGGDDTLLGREGSDTLYGGVGDDVVVGGVGADWLSGGNDDDVILGGEGIDRIVGDDGHDVIHGGADDDFLWGKNGDDQLWGGGGDDVIDEGIYSGAEVALPGPGADLVDLGSGDDQLFILDLCEVEAGEDLDGGSGNDTLWLPDGLTLTDVTSAGATVTSFETISSIVGAPWGGSECAA